MTGMIKIESQASQNINQVTYLKVYLILTIKLKKNTYRR